ncbi:MAG: hypothetical protein ACPG5T_02930, partial [Endozoicomonas sp.]
MEEMKLSVSYKGLNIASIIFKPDEKAKLFLLDQLHDTVNRLKKTETWANVKQAQFMETQKNIELLTESLKRLLDQDKESSKKENDTNQGRVDIDKEQPDLKEETDLNEGLKEFGLDEQLPPDFEDLTKMAVAKAEGQAESFTLHSEDFETGANKPVIGHNPDAVLEVIFLMSITDDEASGTEESVSTPPVPKILYRVSTDETTTSNENELLVYRIMSKQDHDAKVYESTSALVTESIEAATAKLAQGEDDESQITNESTDEPTEGKDSSQKNKQNKPPQPTIEKSSETSQSEDGSTKSPKDATIEQSKPDLTKQQGDTSPDSSGLKITKKPEKPNNADPLKKTSRKMQAVRTEPGEEDSAKPQDGPLNPAQLAEFYKLQEVEMSIDQDTKAILGQLHGASSNAKSDKISELHKLYETRNANRKEADKFTKPFIDRSFTIPNKKGAEQTVRIKYQMKYGWVQSISEDGSKGELHHVFNLIPKPKTLTRAQTAGDADTVSNDIKKAGEAELAELAELAKSFIGHTYKDFTGIATGDIAEFQAAGHSDDGWLKARSEDGRQIGIVHVYELVSHSHVQAAGVAASLKEVGTDTENKKQQPGDKEADTETQQEKPSTSSFWKGGVKKIRGAASKVNGIFNSRKPKPAKAPIDVQNQKEAPDPAATSTIEPVKPVQGASTQGTTLAQNQQ